VLPWSERFFARHGPKTIFLGRFVAVLRVTAAWLAGISKMHWWLFFAWNAAGGICWAIAVGLVAYFAGQAAAEAIGRYGLIAGAAIVVLLVVGAVVFHFIRRRMLGAESEA
jgi:membrane protein DedA with SNARE-associated domain